MTGARATALTRAGFTMLVAVGVDQLAKALVRGSIDPGQTISLVPGIDLVRVANEGVAFGLLNGLSSAILILIGVLFTAALGVVLVREAEPRPDLWLPIGLLAGGAIGNLIDRIVDGSVTDFVQLPHWPAFNVADIEITAGVLLLVWALLAEQEG